MMKMSTWLLVAVVVAVVAVAPRFATAAQQGDMYLLVRQWSPTFCEDRSCVKGQDPEMMTIHGLWYVCSPPSLSLSFSLSPSLSSYAHAAVLSACQADWDDVRGRLSSILHQRKV